MYVDQWGDLCVDIRTRGDKDVIWTQLRITVYNFYGLKNQLFFAGYH